MNKNVRVMLRFAGNYANISPLMDVIFGTYRCPAHEPESFGVTDYSPRGYFAQLLYPLVPRKWWHRQNKPEAIASPLPANEEAVSA